MKKKKNRKKREGCAEGRLMAQMAGMSMLRGSQSQQQIGRRLNHSSIESQSQRNFLLRSVAAHTAM
jgi:hypothetical protein